MDVELEHVLEVCTDEGCRRIVLEEATYAIGRWTTNSIVIDAPEISRQHAILLRIAVPDINQHVFRLVDGNLKGQRSTNGVFVNGKKITSHILRDGDEIEFGGRTKACYSCALKSKVIGLGYFNFSDHVLDPFSTTLAEKTITLGSTDAEMARLVSFLELSPHPIIELDLSGKITYLNPASMMAFPSLKQVKTKHPILCNLIDLVQNAEETAYVREVELEDATYQEAIYYLPESQLIRLNLLDITRKKHAEAELLKRDNLLQVLAQATKTLLAELDHEKAVQEVLSAVGRAAAIDTIFVCQNIESTKQRSSVSFQFQWSLNEIPGLKEIVLNRYKVTDEEAADKGSCYDQLSKGYSVKYVKSEISCKSSGNNGISMLLVPIFLKKEYWGFIGAVNQNSVRQWSIHEESSLFTLATTISAALNRKQIEEGIRHRALYDPLTELPNRCFFSEQLSFCLKNAHRNKQQLSVMFLDLDRFKTINDTLGHTMGDQLLKEAASRISHVLREGDIAARWGGDEFTILLPHIQHLDDSVNVAERILRVLEMVFEIEGNELYITGSIGITLLDCHNHDAETLIKNADIALYMAKEKGRNTYEIYNHSLDLRTSEKLNLDKDMRRALIQEEFIVYYQPRVDLANHRITGFEALIRWKHPEMGLVSPQTFISLAEENGLIIPMGEWVLRQACSQNKRWQNDGLSPMIVSVNLSPKQFRQSNLLERVEKILAETGLDAQYLELEITESEAIHDISYTTEIIEELHRMGVKVSVDDFGTGHSSLNRLQSLNFDNLKIDKSFIRDLIPNSKLSHIVSTIVSLGQKLGMHIIAEGVEAAEQLDFLKSIHCDTVQGYFFYKPIPADKMKEILQFTSRNEV